MTDIQDFAERLARDMDSRALEWRSRGPYTAPAALRYCARRARELAAAQPDSAELAGEGEQPDPAELNCDWCGDPISESDQDLMIEHMHEGCYDEAREENYV